MKTKAVVCGVGNRLRGDDRIGIEVVHTMMKKTPKDTILFDCGNAPENFIGKIRELSPEHVIIVDAVDMKKDAGTVEKIDIERIPDYVSSTHNAPLLLFVKALSDVRANVAFVGIQPKETTFGKELSPEVNKAASKAARMVTRIIQS